MKILMVCLGNICRSPLAEGIMKEKLKKYSIDGMVDSAGTAAYHVGEMPDPRSVEVAGKNGIDITYQRARKFKARDLDEFDLIFAMDEHNYQDILSSLSAKGKEDKVKMILNATFPGKDFSVPDPYYGGKDGFDNVYDMLDKACEKIASEIALAKKND